MTFWFSYQAEIEAFGVGNSITAKGCNAGVNPAQACTFREFLRHVSNGGNLELPDRSKVSKNLKYFILGWCRKTEADVLQRLTDARKSRKS